MIDRFTRQIRIKDFGKEGQDKLSKASVLVIGAGGLGCPVVTYLSAAGLGRIGLVDHDKIEESNLHRQPLYTSEALGRFKAEVAAEKARLLNPELSVEAYLEKLTPANALDLISRFDLIMDCTDNFPARYLINDACVIAGKPWVFAAVETWHMQIVTLNLTQQGKCGPTYRCLFPEQPSAEESPNCAETGVMGTVTGVAGTIQANEAIKVLTGIGEPLSGRLLTIDLLSNTFHTLSFSRNEKTAQVSSLLPDYGPDTACPADTLVEITTDQLRTGKKQYSLIDIREEYEWEMDGAGENIPYYTLLQHPEKIEPDRHYILICESGIRSRILAETLRKKFGLVNIQSLKGGIRKFKESNG